MNTPLKSLLSRTASLSWLFTLFISAVQAQQIEKTIIPLAEEIVIHSKILNEDRKIYVHVNPDARTAGTACPVMYMLDGENHLALTAGLADYISKNTLNVPQMILVGIDNNHYDRQRDLTPTYSPKKDPVSPPDTSINSPTRTSGGGEKFLEFIEKEVIPYVDSHFKTLPFKIFSGHSLGGLLTMHCFLHHPERFGAYIGISPSIWWDDEFLIKNTARLLQSGKFKNKKLFYSIAGEGGQFYKDLEDFNRIIRKNKEPELLFLYKQYPGESHTSSPVKAYYEALQFIFKDLILPSEYDGKIELLEAYYHQSSIRYGYTILPPEGLINKNGYEMMEKQKLKEALAFFNLNVRNYPKSANVYDSLGDGYIAAADSLSAISAFSRALELDPVLEETRQKLMRLKNK